MSEQEIIQGNLGIVGESQMIPPLIDPDPDYTVLFKQGAEIHTLSRQPGRREIQCLGGGVEIVKYICWNRPSDRPEDKRINSSSAVNLVAASSGQDNSVVARPAMDVT